MGKPPALGRSWLTGQREPPAERLKAPCVSWFSGGWRTEAVQDLRGRLPRSENSTHRPDVVRPGGSAATSAPQSLLSSRPQNHSSIYWAPPVYQALELTT